MMDIINVSIREIAEWLRNNPEKELGFREADDTVWYGVIATRLFDAYSLLFGEYGCGVIYSDPTQNAGNSYESIIMEFCNQEDIDARDFDTEFLVDVADWENL